MLGFLDDGGKTFEGIGGYGGFCGGGFRVFADCSVWLRELA
jgi:hypothetical protein